MLPQIGMNKNAILERRYSSFPDNRKESKVDPFIIPKNKNQTATDQQSKNEKETNQIKCNTN